MTLTALLLKQTEQIPKENTYLQEKSRLQAKLLLPLDSGRIHMGIDLPIDLLKLVRTGSIEISENHSKSIKFSFQNNKITVDLMDITVNIPTTKGIFARLSEAREFAKKLKKKDLTLCISHKGKIVMKLGKEAKPKLSRMITQSSAVEITNLQELRRLDKRLRLK